VYHDVIYLYANNHFIYKHKKVDGSNMISTDIRHYLNTFEKKPKAIKNSFALKSIPRLKSIYELYFKSSPRKFIELIRKYQDKKIEDIIQAIEYEVIQAKRPTLPRQANVTTRTLNQLSLYQQLSLKEGRQTWIQ
jgi:hypothetical protein